MKKLLSLLLAIIMVLGMFPMTIFAEETENTNVIDEVIEAPANDEEENEVSEKPSEEEQEPSEEEQEPSEETEEPTEEDNSTSVPAKNAGGKAQVSGGSAYATLQAAINDCPTDGTEKTITLLADTKENVETKAGQKIILDLNGKVINAGGTGYALINNGVLTVIDSGSTTASHKYVVGADGLWTLDDTKEGGTAYEELKARPAENDVIIVKGGAITGGNAQYGGGISNRGTFTLKGGNIAGNKSNNFTEDIKLVDNKMYNNTFGTVLNLEGCTFNIENGRIIGNVTYKSGESSITPGKYLPSFGNVTNLGTLNMFGGDICFNTNDLENGTGGGVQNKGNFTMDGGTISYNMALYGGGVCIYKNTFTLKKGTISNNKAVQGGGVLCTKDAASTFIMEGGTISGNTAEKYGGGVNNTKIFIMSGGIITGNVADSVGDGSGNGGGVCCNGSAKISSTTKVSGTAKITGNTKGTGKTATTNNAHLCNGETSITLIVPEDLTSGAKIGISSQTAPTATAPVAVTTAANAKDYSEFFFSDDTAYTIYNDGSESTQQIMLGFGPVQILDGTKAGFYKTLQEALNAVEAGATEAPATATKIRLLDNITEDVATKAKTNVELDLNGKTITSKGEGLTAGVLRVSEYSILTLKDSGTTGKITGGKGKGGKFGSYGGGVQVDRDGTFNMEGGTISGNNVTGKGGGVNNIGTFNMSGGTITENSAGKIGGGVHNDSSYGGAVFNMTGGTITGNKAGTSGGGVENEGSMTASGDAKISGNTNSDGTKASNVYLPNGKTITVGFPPFGDDAEIGVTLETGKGFVTGASEGDFSVKFTSDNPAYCVFNFVNELGQQVKLGDPVVKNVETGVKYGSIQLAAERAESGQTLKLLADHAENITVNPEGEQKISLTLDLDGYVFSSVEDSYKPVITIGSNGTLTLKDSNTSGRSNYFKYVKNGAWIWDKEATEGIDISEITDTTVDNTVIKIKGGCITGGNLSSAGDVKTGAGICNVGTFNMEGGYIIGNTTNTNNFQQTGGAGVNNFDAVFNLKGGAIIGNTSKKSIGMAGNPSGAGVLNSANSTFNMSGGAIMYNSNPSGAGGGVGNSCGSDESIKSTITAGTISHNTALSGAGINICAKSELTITNGKIYSNKATQAGGGIQNNGGSCYIKGGEIYSNQAGTNGGGVENHNNAVFEMTAGKIYENSAANGSGIYNDNPCTVKISGGKISGNQTANAGFGVHNKNGVKLILGGDAVISGNTRKSDSSVNNLYIPSGFTFDLGTGSSGNGVAVPKKGMEIHVISEATPTETLPVAISSGNTADYSEYFISDNADYSVSNGDSNVLLLSYTPYAAEILNGAKAGKYNTLQDALDAVEVGTSVETIPSTVTKIKLLKNTKESVTTKDFSNVEIDYDGKTHSVPDGENTVFSIDVSNVTIKNGTINGISSKDLCGIENNGGLVTVDNMTISVKSTTSYAYAIFLEEEAPLVITNSKISASAPNEGKYMATGIMAYTDIELGDGNEISVTGAKINTALYAGAETKITVTGGKYVGGLYEKAESSEIEISGGKFSESKATVDTYCKEGYTGKTLAETEAPYKTEVCEAVAAIVGSDGKVITNYTSLQEALDAVEAGATEAPATATKIKLLKDTKESVKTKEKTNVELDLNEKTITNTGDHTVDNLSVLSIKNGKVVYTSETKSLHTAIYISSEATSTSISDIEIEANAAEITTMGISNDGDAALTIKDTKITASGKTVYGIMSQNDVTLGDGIEVNVTGTTEGNALYIYGSSSKKMTVTGGKYVGKLLTKDDAVFEISGGKFSEPKATIDTYCKEGYIGRTLADSEAPYKTEVTKKIYAVIYSDGYMVFQEGNTPDASHGTVLGTYTDFDTGIYSSSDSVSWKANVEKVTYIQFKDKVKPENTQFWFYGMKNLVDGDFDKLDASETDSMKAMFKSCKKFNPTKAFPAGFGAKATNMADMFHTCYVFNPTAAFPAGFGAEATDMFAMFELCKVFNPTNAFPAGFGAKATNLQSMFEECAGFNPSINIFPEGFGAEATNIRMMFRKCTSLTSIDLSNMDTRKVATGNNVFNGSTKLQTITLGANWKFEGAGETRIISFIDAKTDDTYGGHWSCISTGDNKGVEFETAKVPNGAGKYTWSKVTTVTTGTTEYDYDSKEHRNDVNVSGPSKYETTYNTTSKPKTAGTHDETYTVTPDKDDCPEYETVSGTVTTKIKQKQLTVSGTVVSDKEYDAKVAATATLGTVSGICKGDTVTASVKSAVFENKNVGEGKKVTVVYELSGTDAGNYIAPVTDDTFKAKITKKELTVTGTVAETKTYDGNTTATISTKGTLQSVQSNEQGTADTVSINTATGTFENKDNGTNKKVTVVYTLTGTDAGNYTVANSEVKANINKVQLTISTESGKTTTVKDKDIDGKTTAEATVGTVVGVVGTEDVKVEIDSANFDNKDVGENKTVTVKYKVSGNDSGNYIKPVDDDSFKAKISIRIDFEYKGSSPEGPNDADRIYEYKAYTPYTPEYVEDYIFLGWYKDEDCTEEWDNTVVLNDNVTIYGKWEEDFAVLNFNAKGGKKAPNEQEMRYTESAFIPETKPYRNGYTFIGWSTNPKATYAEYQPGDLYKPAKTSPKDATLYAVWREKNYIIIDGEDARENEYNPNTGAPVLF